MISQSAYSSDYWSRVNSWLLPLCTRPAGCLGVDEKSKARLGEFVFLLFHSKQYEIHDVYLRCSGSLTYLKQSRVGHLGDLDDRLPRPARRHRGPDGDGLLGGALRLRAELA